MPSETHIAASDPGGGSRVGRALLLGGACAGMLCLYAVALWWGALNQDEGWYLYAGRLVAEGQMPYRDFLFTQGPVMAYVYAGVYPLVLMGGVFAGRLFTAGLGLLSVGLAAYLARLMASRRGIDPFWPVLLVIGFCGLNLYQVYFTTIVKTYSLAAVCVLGGLICLERALADDERKISGGAVVGQAVLGGVLLALAAGTRLSAAFLLPACWVPLAIRWLRSGRDPLVGRWLLGLLAGGTAGVLLVFGPFLLYARDGLQFGLLTYHTGRAVESWFSLLAYKGGFVLRWVQAYGPLLAAGILVHLCDGCRCAETRAKATVGGLRLPLWTCLVVVTVMHAVSVFPYDDYQVFIMPLAAVAVALSFGALLTNWRAGETARLRWVAGLLLLLFVASLSGGLLQDWLLGPRDRIWWPLRTESTLAQLRRVGGMLREGQRRSDIDATMITQDTYLAVEGGFRVPQGMEMGPFSNFLALSDADAALYALLNRRGLHDSLARTDAQWMAYSAYGFSIQAPSVTPIPDAVRVSLLAILQQRFVLFDVVPAFGQAQTDLYIYKKASP